MKKKVLLIVSTFLLWTLVFILQKPVFLAAFGGLPHLFAVVWHGLPLDLSMAGYLTAIPGLALLVSAVPLRQLHGPAGSMVLTWVVRLWFAIAAILVSLAFVANLALYGYWGFPLDSTPVFFILSSPSAAMASVEWWQALSGLVGVAVSAAIIGLVFHPLWMWYGKGVFEAKPSRLQWLPLLLLEALLFLPIRGGVTVSTMNTGKAYFSQTQELNHAAVNPLFSFMESMTHQEDFGKMYRFMDDKAAASIFRQTLRPLSGEPHITRVLSDSALTRHPDIYIVILESFSDTLTRRRGVTPNLNRLKSEGVYFRHFYANGFRTDRGLVSILLGYPAPGAVSLMKYPNKTARIPSIASHLKKMLGYKLDYYYGGDADFTNMRSFLVNQGFEDITEDRDFPVGDRLSKWGVPDHLLFARAESDIRRRPDDGPHFTVIQTSSSHEPFDVPYHRISDKVLNAFAYTDSCIGGFVSSLKKTGKWRNSLVVFVPDHLGAWPKEADNFASWRYHIPMVWVGGAIREPMVVDAYGSQQDLGTTLLSQLGLPGLPPFSKDMLDSSVRHYACFMPNDGFGVKTDNNEVIYDNKQRRVVVSKGKGSKELLKDGQALQQVLFNDISKK